MNTETPPPNRLWNLEGWRLRWKVTAVVAIPVTVAMVLGALRVQEELSAAAHFSEAADQTSIVAPLLAMDTAFGLYVGGAISRTGSPSDAEQVTEMMAAMRETAANPDLDPAVVANVERLIDETEALRGQIANMGVEEVAARTVAIQDDAAKTVSDVISPIGDDTILKEGNRLVDAWAAQRRLFGQTMAILALVENPKAPNTALISANGSELALIDVLARYFPEDDPTLTTLRQAVKDRTDMVSAAPSGQPPLFELRDSMIASQQIYTNLIKNSTSSITNKVAAKASETRSAAMRDAAVVLATLLATIALGLLVARSLIRPIRRLRRGALQVANEDLPKAIEQIKVGDVTAVTEFEPIPVHTNEEIGQLARAVDDMHGQALKLAGEQAHLRLQIGDMFETLARRSKSLVDQQLGLIENLEFEEKDPKRLESLFRLDHLAARMRRNGENLLILSGTRTRRGHSAPVQVGDVVRAAMSEVEDYQRVEVKATPQGAISGTVAIDVVHLLAELLDNSLRASPPDSKVTFNFARAVDGGLLLEITDRGIGIPAAEMAAINDRLASGGEVSPETARHMGLFVASRLADHHGLTVRMRPTFDTARNQGVTVSVHVPHSALVSPMSMGMTGPQSAVDSDGYPVTGEQPAVAEPAVPVTVTVGPGPLTTGPIGLPQRTPAEPSGLPQRTPAEPSGLPQRTPAEPNGLPRRTPAMLGVLAQRASAAQEDLAQSSPSAPSTSATSAPSPSPQPSPLAPTAGLPQRTPGASGLPQRTPGATTGLPPLNPEVSAPAPAAAPTPVVESAPAAPATMAEGMEPAGTTQHRYRVNSQKTASFFQPRANVEPLRPILHPQETTPIFSGMVSTGIVSDWLATPTPGEGSKNWTSAADEGWNAAQRASAPRVEAHTESGLPQRQPGHQLVPGGVNGADKITAKLRDPDAIREKLSRHQKGIRDGRAASHAERNSI
ncbi:signal transduction histidine kinase [Rhodococcus sp. PvR044]|uniref:ATP-binding protein n=1 Tax=unclassified Rhodococcus (in: high G+C Gram-positive bacteria) TaxID=192944 RepID=UPI001AE2DCA9|nr:ATP-binding protein [Rhodococcus sp. PvR099]MBP1161425.1 signal transduction histidine kinase [Rhodococcus sp. PvR099]